LRATYRLLGDNVAISGSYNTNAGISNQVNAECMWIEREIRQSAEMQSL